jgi:glycosyltransferase involved in cell wall biosynthesis
MYDLLNEENSIPLKTQRPVDGQYAASMQGWGESDIDEIVAALEFAYEDRERVRALGRRSRDWLIEHDRTWQAHARDLKSWLLST